MRGIWDWLFGMFGFKNNIIKLVLRFMNEIFIKDKILG